MKAKPNKSKKGATKFFKNIMKNATNKKEQDVIKDKPKSALSREEQTVETGQGGAHDSSRITPIIQHERSPELKTNKYSKQINEYMEQTNMARFAAQDKYKVYDEDELERVQDQPFNLAASESQPGSIHVSTHNKVQEASSRLLLQHDNQQQK